MVTNANSLYYISSAIPESESLVLNCSALTLSNELKNRGNELFKAHRYAESRDAYTHALNVLCNAAEVSGFCDGSEGLTIPQDMLTAFKAKPELRDDWPTHIDTAQVEEIRFQLMPSLLCNLCAAEIWLETYGAAFQYASWALDVSNNKFAKAYYRRAAAAVYLNQLKNAISGKPHRFQPQKIHCSKSYTRFAQHFTVLCLCIGIGLEF